MSKKTPDDAAPTHDRSKFQGLEVADLLDYLKTQVKEIYEQTNQVLAIGYGGEAYAQRKDAEGNMRDITAAEMFKVIIDISSRCRPIYELEDAIAELTLRSAAAS